MVEKGRVNWSGILGFAGDELIGHGCTRIHTDKKKTSNDATRMGCEWVNESFFIRVYPCASVASSIFVFWPRIHTDKKIIFERAAVESPQGNWWRVAEKTLPAPFLRVAHITSALTAPVSRGSKAHTSASRSPRGPHDKRRWFDVYFPKMNRDRRGSAAPFNTPPIF